jgi:hypothetical protein
MGGIFSVTMPDIEPKMIVWKKPIISRWFHRCETTGDKNRIVFVKYIYNRVNQKLVYAGVVWCVDKNSNEKCNFEEHLELLGKRMESPVVIENFTDNGTLKEFHDKIRMQLFRKGCFLKC